MFLNSYSNYLLMNIGVLAFQGGVIEHIKATKDAAKKLGLKCDVVAVKYKNDFNELDRLIIPGGESTTLWKLIEREGIVDKIKSVKAIFGTCAGAIMIAKKVKGLVDEQKSLDLVDIETDRNAYGPQTESFETDIETALGKMHAVFIRAPKINVEKNVRVLGKLNNEIVAAEQRTKNKFYLITSFHPELTTTLFHEYFLRTTSRL